MGSSSFSLSRLSLGVLLLISSAEGFLSPHGPLRSNHGLNMAGGPCPELKFEPKTPGNEVACVACGWFWHPQLQFKQIDGVVDCVVGYSGGTGAWPTYQNIQDYTEAMIIEYNPERSSYDDILREWSGMDYPFVQQKTQYRSAIFTIDDNQHQQALEFVEKLRDQNLKEVFVDVEPVTKFFRGEEYHQDFLAKQKSSRAFRMY